MTLTITKIAELLAPVIIWALAIGGCEVTL